MNRTTLGPTGTPRPRQTSTVLAWTLPHLLAHEAECGYDATPLRRLPGLGTANSVRVYEFDRFRLDPKRRLLTRDGEPVVIQPKALDTLLLLVQHRGRLLELDTCWRRRRTQRLQEYDRAIESLSIVQRLSGNNSKTISLRGYILARIGTYR